MVSFNVKINEKVHEVKDIDNNLFVGEVKSVVENISGVPKECQKWIYKGRILTDQMTLLDANIVDGNTVIVMRTAASRAAPSGAPAAAPAAAQNAPMNNISINNASYDQPYTRPLPSTERFDTAMFELLQNSDETVVQAAVTILLKVISNIILHPLEEKYRKLNKTNAAFSKKVGSISGGSSCMIALGFQIMGDEWVLVPSADAWENITSCKTKLEKFAKRLSDQIASSSGQAILPVAPATSISSAPTEPAQSVVPVPLAAPGAELSTLEMQQFLVSLSTMQTSAPAVIPDQTPEAAAEDAEEAAAIAAAIAMSELEDIQGDIPAGEGNEEDKEEAIPQL